jgi:hypothetical protein
MLTLAALLFLAGTVFVGLAIGRPEMKKNALRLLRPCVSKVEEHPRYARRGSLAQDASLDECDWRSS